MQSKTTSHTSLVLSLLSWIPLLNLGIAPSAVYFGIKALREIKKNPEKYSGRIYAIIGIVIGGLTTIFTYYWFVLKVISFFN